MMTKLEHAKTYAMDQKYSAKSPRALINEAAEKFGLTQKERGTLQAFVYQQVFAACDASMCNGASLKALKLPLNRIAEAFV